MKPQPVKCPLCGSGGYDVIQEHFKNNARLLQCKSCGQMYVKLRSKKDLPNGRTYGRG